MEHTADEREGTDLKSFSGLSPERQDLVLTVLYVPNSLDSSMAAKSVVTTVSLNYSVEYENFIEPRFQGVS